MIHSGGRDGVRYHPAQHDQGYRGGKLFAFELSKP